MPDLVKQNAAAMAWVDRAKAAYSGNVEFGHLASSVIWSDVTGPDGKPLVPIDDPESIVADINANGCPLLIGHDPGRPAGKALTAAVFTNLDGSKFIAALLGFYQGAAPLGFRDLGLESMPRVASPSRLPALPDSCHITFGYDSREVDAAWIDDVLDTAPLRVDQEEASYNAAESLIELISLGLPYIALVWNPFVTAIATEAGKDTYTALNHWVRRLLGKLAERKNPVLEIRSRQNDCHVSFIFRGTDAKRHYTAHDARPLAAEQAATLIANMKSAGVAPKKIVYEFHTEDNMWFPSYAELHDGRFITDNSLLIAVEKMPSGLSIGVGLGKEKARLPSVKRLPPDLP
jgi:hypothetical protein